MPFRRGSRDRGPAWYGCGPGETPAAVLVGQVLLGDPGQPCSRAEQDLQRTARGSRRGPRQQPRTCVRPTAALADSWCMSSVGAAGVGDGSRGAGELGCQLADRGGCLLQTGAGRRDGGGAGAVPGAGQSPGVQPLVEEAAQVGSGPARSVTQRRPRARQVRARTRYARRAWRRAAARRTGRSPARPARPAPSATPASRCAAPGGPAAGRGRRCAGAAGRPPRGPAAGRCR